MKTTKLPLNAIKPYWRNPRKNENAVNAVVQSIQEFGYNQPIVVDHEYTIIVGHTRYKALQLLGWSKADVIIADLTDKQAKKYRIADNKTAELADWDFENLIPELREVGSADMQIYFQDVDLDGMLKESLGQGVKPVEQAQVDKIAEGQAVQFENRDKDYNDDLIEVACPHCGETFHVSRSDVNARAERAARGED